MLTNGKASQYCTVMCMLSDVLRACGNADSQELRGGTRRVTHTLSPFFRLTGPFHLFFWAGIHECVQLIAASAFAFARPSGTLPGTSSSWAFLFHRR